MADEPFSFFLAEHLPHFVNTAEWNLASAGTNATPINFLLYVPKRSQHPLYVLDKGKEAVPGNAWLVPGWGGVHISNLALDLVNSTSAVKGAKFHYGRKELRSAMSLYVAQLRSLLGVQPVLMEKDFLSPPASLPRLPLIASAPDPDRGITDLELDRLSRKRAAQNVLDSARGLASLGKLVSSMPNMVVPDRIRTGVEASLAQLDAFFGAIAKGELDAAFAHSAEALSLSEAAFFDHTMVSMLYFPDEHKYAVYMPFFVPVGVPLIVGLINEIKRWREKRRKAKAE
jgi:phosphatidylinositol glycan class S